VRFPAAVLLLVVTVLGRPAGAHHSFAAEFDAARPVELAGTVTKVEWVNPHVWLYADVQGDEDAIVHWKIELGPPAVLSRLGWRQDSLKPGDRSRWKAIAPRTDRTSRTRKR